MIKKSIGFKVLILPLSLAVVVVAVIFYMVPTFQEMSKAKVALAETQAQIQIMEDNTAKLNKIKSEWEASAEDQELIDQALPNSEDSEKFMAELYSKASQSGMLLSGISIGGNESVSSSSSQSCNSAGATGEVAGEAQPISSNTQVESNSSAEPQQADPDGSSILDNSACAKSLEFSIIARGTWSQIQDFLKYVNESSRFASVNGVQIESNSAENSSSVGQETTQNTAVSSESASDILGVSINVEAYFKGKAMGGDAMSVLGAVDSGTNQKIIQKINDSVFRPYQVQAVESGGERNPFK
ncbi:MAG: hypothetical protein WC858_05445 [Parcubacteria group bacterium]|jgi:Tfp pilus assembly protein PilO